MNEAPPAPTVISDHVDYLRMTLPPEIYYVIALGEVHESCRALNGYTHAVRTEDGVQWMTSPERPDMGCSVLLDGETCRKLRQSGRFRPLVEQLVSVEGARATRIDVAFDVASRATLELARDSVVEGKYVSRSKRTSNSVTSSGDGGLTVTIGKRQSENYLRMYDKAAEQGVPGEWVRFELEVKAERAQSVLRAWLDGVTCAQLVGDFVRFTDRVPYGNNNQSKTPNASWWLALISAPVKVCTSRQKLVKNQVKRLIWFERHMLNLALEYRDNVSGILENLEQCKPLSSSLLSTAAR